MKKELTSVFLSSWIFLIHPMLHRKHRAMTLRSMYATSRDCMHLDKPTMGEPMTPAFTQTDCACINLCYATLNLTTKSEASVSTVTSIWYEPTFNF